MVGITDEPQRITIKTIKKSYVERHAMNLILKFGDTDQQPTEETPLSSLNKYKDNLVVVRAVEVSAASEHDLSAASLIQPSSSAPLGQEPFGHNTPATNGMKQINRHERAHQALNVMEESGDDPQAHIDDSGDAEELNDRKYQLPSPAVKKERSLSPKFEPAVSRQPSQASDSDMNDPQDSSGNVGKERHMSLQQLMKSPLPETLERGVQEAVQLLEKLKLALRKQSAEKNIADADNWTTSITNLQEQAVRTRTVVGVVGNTGAGKSSVINAMLDEERLVPTNCMRACTAVVTELSWNDDDDENKKYRAAIEFIKPEDWERELKVLFNDLLDQNGQVSRDCANPDSDAGVAYAKIKAVYPQMTKEDIARSSVAKLMKFPIVAEVLGTTIKIEKAEPEGFYRKLQTYVDSKEKIIKKDKGTGTGKDKEKKEPRKTEYWPLIKVVRIFVRSPALATGAVIVDLPGVQDSNAARAAVAAGYMKQCTGLWIVAPITRAVDDKSAKNLLGDTFKRQLKYDGTYSAVTFICSKTDDISITEATDSLGLEDRMSELFSQEDSIEQTIKELEKRLVALKDEKEVFSEMFDDQDELLAVWERLSNKLGDGEKVFRPLQKKRKSNLATDKPRKRRASSDDDFLADTDSDRSNLSGSDSEKEDETEDQEEERQPLTEEDIATEINQIRVFKKKARSSKAELEDKIRQVRKEITAAKFEHNEVQAKMNTICISGRNDYSRRAIQFDFAAGVEELDQENAIEEDEENFNPDDEKRDYEQVARDLPVFCVSSRAYQKLSGRLKKDSAVPGFTTLDQTEIPALQAHCKKLTEAGRSSSCRRFLNNLNQLLTSISLWASDDGSGATLTDQQKVREVLFLKKKLAELEKVSTDVSSLLSELVPGLSWIPGFYSIDGSKMACAFDLGRAVQIRTSTRMANDT
ncbi:hypothetical protein EJ05DRAFT_368999 [Pseudovirgaria hyperparasitica]|uniref:Dynamin N-terminal domain-containing protein n=1 Tax=Pseudovirgaria hyperparasitica TaxID=470096 RepID=A0A6A6W8G7_9PEZI|nr:uncharacterized protein EJ05DRAFT_368999 [Pseudovirgaria hyperparasitica]KAF2757867.1 hypothetical protein EJ05DRAFT_368999 [Pseudovirgaria hyperparasitica]